MAENTLPFIKGVKNKQRVIIAEFSDPKLPIQQSGVEGLQTALGGKSPIGHDHVDIKNEQGNDVAYVECLPDKVRIYAEQELEIELGGEIIHVNAGNVKELILPSRISDGDNGSADFQDGDLHVTSKDVVLDLSDSEGEDILRITESDLVNLARAKRNPDSTPTENSDNLVTSGGVKLALDNKASVVSVQNLEREVSYISTELHQTVHHVSADNKYTITESDLENKNPHMIINDGDSAPLYDLITLSGEIDQHELTSSSPIWADSTTGYGRFLVRFHDFSEQGILNAVVVEVLAATYYEI